MRVKLTLLAGVCAGAIAFPTTAIAQDMGEEDEPEFGNEIIVTAQRQAQSIQDVPIAVSAFSAETLEAQQIENASDLQLTLPNVSFTKSNFTAASFTIRGIGDLCVGVSCDSATAIHLNSAPLFNTRIFETEYFDLERIEVLRGPQGTLFGRNATSGVVNVITAKPDLSGFGGAFEATIGDYETVSGRGMINVPIGDSIGFRVAGMFLGREGYTENLYNGRSIDGRELYSIRGSLRFEPGPDTSLDLMASYFREDDDRLRIQKQLCQRDPTGVLGCLNSRLDFDTTNANSTFTGTLSSREFFAIQGIPTAFGLGSLYGPDPNLNSVNPADLRQVSTAVTPTYIAEEFIAQAHFEQQFGDFQLGLTGTYQETLVDSSQDYNLLVPDRTLYAPALNTLAAFANNDLIFPGSSAYFAPIANAIIPNGPNGELCTSDTRLDNRGAFEGFTRCGDVPLSFDRSNQDTRGWSVEAILSSDMEGPFNFLLGGIYAENEFSENSYYVNSFAIDYVTGLLGTFTALGAGLPPSYLATSFFRNNTQDFRLESFGVFGEAYFDFSEDIALTVGLRYNDDSKSVTARSTLASFLNPFSNDGDPFASPFIGSFDADPGTAGNQLVQSREVAFNEVTGRAVLDWQLTDDTLLYLSYSRGYKSGGINPPLQPIFAVPESFGPETINAFEVGLKNEFLDAGLTLNLTGFYYQYDNLQLSRIIARTSVNDTVDADIWGLEAEAVWQPVDNLAINLSASYLNTEVRGDQFFSNPRDPGGGDPNAVIIKDITNGAHCAVTGAGARAFVGAVNAGLGLQAPTAFPGDSGIASTGAFSICSVLDAQTANPAFAGLGPLEVLSPGVQVNIRGNALPQAPEYKVAGGIQYTFQIGDSYQLTPRFDVAHTGPQFGNIFNGDVNRIDAFTQANAQIQLVNENEGWFVRAFVQNLFDNDSVTGLYVTDASSGLFTNVFSLDPRRYGVTFGVDF